MAKNKPKIRFKGFEDDWEETLYSKEATTRRGLTYHPSDVSLHGIRVLRSSNIADDTFIISDEDVFVNNEAINIDYANNEDILITSANGSQRLVGKHCIIKSLAKDSAVHGGFMLLASAKNPYFLNASMSSAWYSNFIFTNVAGGSGAIGNLNKADLDNYAFLVPKNDEQLKIGEYFKQLDELIEAREKKLEKLRQFKMAMLDKMFPKEGESVPAVRFRGFTEPWKSIKLQSIFDFNLPHYSHSRDKLNYESGEVQNIHYGDILIKFENIVYVDQNQIPFITDAKADNFTNSKLEDFDIIFADTAEDETCGKCIEIQEIGRRTIVAGLHTIVARPLISFAPCYLGYYFNSFTYHDQLIPLMQGIKVLSINKASLYDTYIYYPDNNDEQQKIGKFFRSQDEEIYNLQEQINKLKTFKQACLSQMFV